MSERMSERYVRRTVIRKSVKRYVRKMLERMSKRYVRKNGRRYVRQNVRKYVPKICAHIDLDNKNSCLHQRNLVDVILLFVLFGTLQQVLLAQLCFCARKWVWFGSHGRGCGGTSWHDLHWDCPIRLPKELSMCGATSWLLLVLRMYVCMEPPSTTHAGDLMFIMEEVVEGNKWYVAYEGRPVPNAEGEQELEKRAAVFRTSASFWEDGVHEWETNNVRSRATYAEPAEEPQWRASDFMVCTRHEM